MCVHHVYVCMYIYIYIYLFIYLFIFRYGERERERDFNQKTILISFATHLPLSQIPKVGSSLNGQFASRMGSNQSHMRSTAWLQSHLASPMANWIYPLPSLSSQRLPPPAPRSSPAKGKHTTGVHRGNKFTGYFIGHNGRSSEISGDNWR